MISSRCDANTERKSPSSCSFKLQKYSSSPLRQLGKPSHRKVICNSVPSLHMKFRCSRSIVVVCLHGQRISSSLLLAAWQSDTPSHRYFISTHRLDCPHRNRRLFSFGYLRNIFCQNQCVYVYLTLTDSSHPPVHLLLLCNPHVHHPPTLVNSIRLVHSSDSCNKTVD